MPNIYGMLHVGRTALITHQKALDVTGNNIANINTPGYSRQRLNLEQNGPVRSDAGTLGTCVRAERKIQRLYDQFLNGQINGQTQNLGRWEAQKQTLEKVELMFDETSGYGLNTAMDDFWNAWQDLANNPSGQVERITLVGRSQTVADTFNKLHGDVHRIQEDIDLNVEDSVAQINVLSGQIDQFNLELAKIEITDHNANDLRDQRDTALKELSELIGITSFEDDQGYVNVSTASGNALVDQGSSWELATVVRPADGFKDIVWQDSLGGTTNITSKIDGGKLKGWIQSRDEVIQGYVDRLDELAAGIITEVNTIHESGFTLNGTTNQTFFTGTSASDMSVDTGLAADTNLIAAAAAATGVPGDNTKAVAIAALRTDLTMSTDTTTFDDFFGSLVSQIGTDVSSATTNYDHQTTVLDSLSAYREEVSGVSLDEEMVNLVKSQHAYSAAAKLIQTVDDLLGTTINMI